MTSLLTATTLKTTILTILALIAFAANSVLCRLALDENSIDAASFTLIRLLSGALVLALILVMLKRFSSFSQKPVSKGSWSASLMLFIYALCFSFAYISLDTATGALILFGSVQITMILLSLFSNNRLQLSEWLGLIIAFTGFVYLILPELSTPSLNGFILMSLSGIAWGIYSLIGRGSQNAIMDTAYNFLRTLPLLLIVAAFTFAQAHLSQQGIILAIFSGAIASGMGYAIWYMALAGLTATKAAVVQLSVPVIAAFGGVIFVAEAITQRLTLSSLMVLGGIFIVIASQYYLTKARNPN
ncbi:hypothetical protein THMIRHAM_09880 [Thiomicrorhabdus immobilis]|uniref:EamA domain-containing protein n=1 Tax=Thiomicrorhabdus immobilis TaxID=2791037 RepID=A0ABN6CVY1_9GAMM|nr:DMT family transporter [Thiomicrorhabdus immobilis]BCN93203.1 hypothetical protein THMIRHAM_09880 [Thiomicrorhabdus immobilis]